MKWLAKYQDGKSLKETDTTKWIDSIHGANMDKKWVQDLLLKNGPDIQVKGYDDRSTHLMSQYDNIAAPQVARKDGLLEYDPMYELEQGNGIEFKNDQDALDYTREYKKGTGVLKQDGGWMDEVVKDNEGYWNPDNHGKIVEINSNNITMEGVDQELLGVSDTGDTKVMKPGGNYKFKGNKVREYPMGQDGMNVSAKWRKTTGTSWAKAKERGLTDGSYESNIALSKELDNGTYDREPTAQQQEIVSDNMDFNQAFAQAREVKGANSFFKYNGETYRTNFAGETFEPAPEELKKFNLDNAEVKQNIENVNKKVESVYVPTATVDNTPVSSEPKWQNWEDVKARDTELNKMSNADLINKYHSKESKSTVYTVKSGDNLSVIAKNAGVTVKELKANNKLKDNVIRPGDKLKIETPAKDSAQYLIVDKASGKTHLYRAGKQIASFDMLVGENEGDAQTVTKPKDPSDDGKAITKEEVKRAKIDWAAGNKSTGAGEFTVSTVNPTSKPKYGGAPSFNLKNDSGIEVSTTLHGSPSRRKYYGTDDPKQSNGCINGKCEDLEDLYSTYGLTKGDKVYILPEDKGNQFNIRNNKLVFDSKSGKDYYNYTDSRGDKQKGQGVNRTVNSLKYNPIDIEFDEEAFREEKFTALDFDDEREMSKTVKPFVAALSKDKQALMKELKIDGDVYNEMAKAAFGIFGVESAYGDTNTLHTNIAKGVVRKGVDWLNEKGYTDLPKTGAPDTQIESMYNATQGKEKEKWASSGLTQIVWGQLSTDDKRLMKKHGITNVRQLNNPKNAAISTLIMLGNRYNNEIKGKKDPVNLETDLAESWNHGKGYADRVKKAQRFINLKELR